ncbi:amidohydrolase [Streptomyces parvulus]|uniref:amidohydrolase n=1 Tax=Streptomyces parvulus TaxID=146923 RepID=UPI0036E78E58
MTSPTPAQGTGAPSREVMERILPLFHRLHAHPELSMREHATAATVTAALRDLDIGLETYEKVGGTGVVALLRNGPGPTVLLRADMDGLPVREDTGLKHASTVTEEQPDGTSTPVMHACGHDSHMVCLIGALDRLAADRHTWQGTVAAVFQPGEETGQGALAMLADGLADLFDTPAVCLAQHVAPLPVGLALTRPGTVMAAADTLRITLHGRGGHASTPETTVDPVLLAAAVVTRLHTLASRELGAHEAAVLTVGSLHAGDKANVIPASARMEVSLRSFDAGTRDRMLAAVERIVRAEAAASGAPREPEIEHLESFPLTVNSPQATATVLDALRGVVPEVRTAGHPSAGAEDFGRFAAAFGCPGVYWFFGGVDAGRFEPSDLDVLQATGRLPDHVPPAHSPGFAIDPAGALPIGVTALVAAAMAFLNTEGK